MPAPERLPVLVVGSGPVGMVTALALHRREVPVVVIEAEPAPVKDQRAASMQPPTIEMLAALGLLPRMLERGLVSTAFRFYDRITGARIAEFDCALLTDDTPYPYVLQHEQFKLVDTILRVEGGTPGFAARFNTRFSALEQRGDFVRVIVATPGGEEIIDAAYVVGCDGGHSAVRRAAGIAFEGFTFPEKFIKIGTTFDFQAARDFCYRNYFSDPDEWCNLFKVAGDGPPGIWRCVFPCRVDESDEAALSPAGCEARLHKFFPGFSNFEIAYRAIYSVSQRVAETFHRGRVLLAGDAAHVNNPIGGLGMNGGIHDAISLAPKLADLWHGLAGADVLDLYTRQRRRAQHEFVQQQTIRNKRELEEKDPAARRRNLDAMKRVAGDPARARAFLRHATLIESLGTVSAVA